MIMAAKTGRRIQISASFCMMLPSSAGGLGQFQHVVQQRFQSRALLVGTFWREQPKELCSVDHLPVLPAQLLLIEPAEKSGWRVVEIDCLRPGNPAGKRAVHFARKDLGISKK